MAELQRAALKLAWKSAEYIDKEIEKNIFDAKNIKDVYKNL